MTTFTGCIGPSDKKIVDKFTDFVNMFPTEDLTVLYDKEGNQSDLKDGDLGTWKISTFNYLTTAKGFEEIGVLIRFNKNTKQANGTFLKRITKNEEVIENREYPIYYDRGKFHFEDENIEESLVEELENFKMMYEFVSIGREYLDTLEAETISYNGNVPLYGASYKLTSEDINIKKIKEIYPNIHMDEDNLILDLSSSGNPWDTNNYISISIHLDDKYENYLTAMMSFDNGDDLKEINSGE